jgi:ParB family transcriptional regulator, chromosome partitioning protein
MGTGLAQKKRGLGRGLDALIEARADTESADQVREIDLDWIEPNPFQPRSEMDREDLESLASSIREHGVIQPVIVTQGDGDAPYRLVAGERRWRAARQAGLRSIPVIVRESSPRSMLELALIENIQRADLNVLEEATAYRQLIEEFGLTHSELAQRVGRSRSAISNALRILQCPEEVQYALLNGSITEGHARALLGLPSSVEQLALLQIIVSRTLSVRQTEQLVREWGEENSEPVSDRRSTPKDDPIKRHFELRMQRALGTRVELRRGKRGGRLIIHYYSEEELEALSSRLLDSDDL